MVQRSFLNLSQVPHCQNASDHIVAKEIYSTKKTSCIPQENF